MAVGCATKNCDFLRRQSNSSRSSGVAGPSASSVTPEVAGMVRKTAHAISTTIAKSIAGMTDRPKVDGPGTSLL
jgi:hypothetical protein